MSLLLEISKLITRCIILVIVALVVSNFVFLPIAEYFWPMASSSDTPLKTLEGIIAHRRKLAAVEAEVAEYGSEHGRSELVAVLNAIDEVSEKSTDSLSLLSPDERFRIDKFLQFYTLRDRVSSLTNSDTLALMDEAFSTIRSYGIYLDSKKINFEFEDEHDSETVEELNARCTIALDELFKLMKEGEELTAEIAKAAAEVESRMARGVSMEDINVTAHVEHFNTESERLTDELDASVRRNDKILKRTKELTLKASKILQRQFDSFRQDTNAGQLKRYQDFAERVQHARQFSKTNRKTENSPLDVKTEL